MDDQWCGLERPIRSPLPYCGREVVGMDSRGDKEIRGKFMGVRDRNWNPQSLVMDGCRK